MSKLSPAQAAAGPRQVLGGIDVAQGQAGRVDVLTDGRIRVVDYKLGRPPDPRTSIQVAVYAHCASQWLAARDGVARPVAAVLPITSIAQQAMTATTALRQRRRIFCVASLTPTAPAANTPARLTRRANRCPP